MKVKIKGLNEEVEVVEEKDIINNRIVYYDKVTHQRYPEDMIEIVDDYATEKVSYVQLPTDWQQVRIQAAIAAMQGLVSNEIHLNHADKVAEEKGINTSTFLAKCAIDCADALVAELKHNNDVYAEGRKMDAINTAAMCENMTKIQKELQKKDDNADV